MSLVNLRSLVAFALLTAVQTINLARATDIVVCEALDGSRLNLEQLPDSTKVRQFRLTYAGKAFGIEAGKTVRGWLPLPLSNEHQRVRLAETSLPGTIFSGREPVYQNCMMHFETKASDSGEISFSMTYDVTRIEVKSLSDKGKSLADRDRGLFLKPNRYVPVSGRPLDLLKDLQIPKRPLDRGRLLYDLTEGHMKYDKSRPGYGRGDAVWACDSRFGNCTDFHSLFISLARANGLPSRFEIGFPLPEERGQGKIGGYHCWAFFHTQEHGWVPTDISEADKHPELKEYYFGNLTENRVAFSVGRDLNLVPKQSGEPLNFFVYPYLEVDGKPLGREHIELSFSYADTE